MVRLSDDVDPGTGDKPTDRSDADDLGRDLGRQLAVDVVTEADSRPSAASDGGLSPAARRWMDATPGVDVEDARRYDRETDLVSRISRSGNLPPRGDRAGPENYDRADVVNTARHLVRAYHELEDRS